MCVYIYKWIYEPKVFPCTRLLPIAFRYFASEKGVMLCIHEGNIEGASINIGEYGVWGLDFPALLMP
jgi:hypothetical protein